MLFTSKVVSYGCKEERVKDIKSFENILLKLNECIFFFQNTLAKWNWYKKLIWDHKGKVRWEIL